MKTSFRRRVGRGVGVAALAALLPLVFAMPAQASDSIDQSVVLSNWLGYQWNLPNLAQTFTAKVSGQVDRVSLPLSTPTGFGLFTVSLNNVNATGQPSAALGSAPFSSAYLRCCGFTDYSFSPAVPVTAGTSYAIVVHLFAGNVKWLDSGTLVPYSGGREWMGGPGGTWLPTTHGDFGFEEWVVSGGATNQAPVLSADRSVVSVAEGSTATNTGPCSDPDGDPLTLTATGGGTVSPCTAGRWTWSLATMDEQPASTITITADDGRGGTSSTQFTLDVVGVDPTAQIVADPPQITVTEGTSVSLSGSATSTAAADNTAGFAYSWTVSLNGATYAGGSGTSFSFVPKDDGSYLVAFNAKDDGGMTGTASMTVLATNVAPVATLNSVSAPASLVTTPLETLSFHGSFTDVDSSDNYLITWNFGDGASATGTDATHAYSAAGTYTVTFQVDDREGGVGKATTTVTVQTTQQALAAIESFVQGLSGLNAGEKHSLSVKLSNAADAIARGDNNAASNELNAFLNELQAYVNSGKVTPEQAATLRTAVNTIRGSLGTFNRLVDWWPLEA